MTRRSALVLPAAAAVSCGGAPRRTVQVSITRCSDYGPDVYDKVRSILVRHGVNARGKRVVLKPNLVDFPFGKPVNTHAAVVHATLEAFRALGAAEILIAEGPGHRRETLEIAESAGYFNYLPGFDRVFVDLNLDQPVRVQIARPRSALSELYVANTALSADLLVSLPKMKTHHWVGATLAMKNLFGTVSGGVYGWPKNILHWSGIPNCILDVASVYPRVFSIVDGIIGMEGDGPLEGKPKPAGVLVAGDDLTAVDTTCCRIMGIDPAKVSYLRLARGHTAIQQIGETISTVETRFELMPHFRHLKVT